jgi:hypothetical protein
MGGMFQMQHIDRLQGAEARLLCYLWLSPFTVRLKYRTTIERLKERAASGRIRQRLSQLSPVVALPPAHLANLVSDK